MLGGNSDPQKGREAPEMTTTWADVLAFSLSLKSLPNVTI